MDLTGDAGSDAGMVERAVPSVRQCSCSQFAPARHRTARPRHQVRIALRDDVRGGGGRLQCQPMRVSYCWPNLNAYAERFIQTLQQECLDHFVVFGCWHLDHLLKEFLEHYQTERPHQGVGNVPLKAPNCAEESGQEAIRCRSRLVGLLPHYHRKAA